MMLWQAGRDTLACNGFMTQGGKLERNNGKWLEKNRPRGDFFLSY